MERELEGERKVGCERKRLNCVHKIIRWTLNVGGVRWAVACRGGGRGPGHQHQIRATKLSRRPFLAPNTKVAGGGASKFTFAPRALTTLWHATGAGAV